MTPPDEDKPPAPPEDEPAARRPGEPGATDPNLRPLEPAVTPAPPSLRRSSGLRAVSVFAPNDLVAGRFRIRRFIAAGGMGEVYEAEDLDLKERVALKTVRPEVADDERGMERFRREIQLARRVTHPSVCRTFDLFRHRLTPPAGWEGPSPEVTFLTMELLEGETLSERIKRSGPVKTADALSIVEQMASALSAAHEAGIIHRDLKSSNVILAATQKGIRAVVTDFGLARGGTAAGQGASITATGAIAGSPAYMAPEQVTGEAITPATDVYALGIVMYEMVTGRRPFEGDTPLTMAIKRLNEPPPPPRGHVPDLDPNWEAAILRSLEREPEDRFASPCDVLKALAGEEVAPGPKRKRRVKQWIALTAAASVLIGLAAGVFLYRLVLPAASIPGGAPPMVKARRSVAVLGFKNLSGRPGEAWLSTALSEMLTMELAAGEALRLVPGESVARMKIDLAFPDTDTLAHDTLARIRKHLGTDLVVLGSYFAAGKEGGGKVRLDLRLQDTAAGETVASLTEGGTEAELPDLVSRSGARLRGKLGLAGLSTAEAGSVKAALPGNPEAARLYSEGLAKLRLFDALAARDRLEKAVAAAPDSPLIRTALAAAWSTLGYDGKAKDEAKQALDLSTSLPREERLFVEGRSHEAAKQWDKAIETYQRLWAFFPDNIEYGLRLVSVQTFARRPKDALATVEALRGLPAPARDDPRIDIAEAEAAQGIADFRRAQAVAEKAVKKGEAQGARLLVARARLLKVSALVPLGELERAKALAEEAREIYGAAGDRGGIANALEGIGNVFLFRGDLVQATRFLRDALAIAREIGHLRRISWVQHILGDVLKRQGDLAGARRMYEGSLATDREMGHRSAATLGSLGIVLREQGDLHGARRLQEQFLAISRDIGERRLIAHALSGLGDLSYAEGDLVEARKKHEEALDVRNEIGAKGTAAESRLALAQVSIEEGKPAEAEEPARRAAEEFRSERQGDSEAAGYAALARALLAQGNRAKAQAAIDQAEALLEKSQDFVVRVTVAIDAARVRAASVQPADAVEALKSLEAALARARKAGFVGLQFEARLALGQIEMKSGQTPAGRAHLEALEKEAVAKGFGLIARKARRALP